MGLLDAFKSKKKTEIVYDNKGNYVGTVQTEVDISRYLGVFDSHVRKGNYITLFSEIAEIQFPVRAITERALQAKFLLKKYDSDEPEYYNRAINKFLSQPNETDTFHTFLSKAIAYYLVTGNAYISSDAPPLLSGNIEHYRRADNYYVLPSDKTEIVYQDRQKLFRGAGLDGIAKGYKVSTGAGYLEFSPENILNIHDLKLSFDSHSLEGESRIDSLKYPVSNIIAAYEARNAIFVKRGALGFIVSRKTDADGTFPLRASEKRQIREADQEAHGVTGGRSPIGIIDVPIDYVNIGASIREMEPFKETLEDAKTIAGMFGVPDALIPGNNQATYNNVSTAEKALYQNTVIPLTNKIIESFNTWLGLSRKWEKGGMYLEADFSEIPCLQEDRKMEADTRRTNADTAIRKYKEGFITKNQALVEMGNEEVPGGDYLIWDDKERNKNQTQNQIRNQNDTQNKL
jgi:HK97 family phage portal protein